MATIVKSRNYSISFSTDDGENWHDLLVRSDYGNDDLHNARLLGAYHCRRGAWPEQMLRWKASLSAEDGIYIDTYERETCLRKRVAPAMLSLGAAMATLASPFHYAAAAALAQTGESMLKCNETAQQAMYELGIASIDWDKIQIAVDRGRLPCFQVRSGHGGNRPGLALSI